MERPQSTIEKKRNATNRLYDGKNHRLKTLVLTDLREIVYNFKRPVLSIRGSFFQSIILLETSNRAATTFLQQTSRSCQTFSYFSLLFSRLLHDFECSSCCINHKDQIFRTYFTFIHRYKMSHVNVLKQVNTSSL